MASPQSFRVRIQRLSAGSLMTSATSIKLGVSRNENQPIEVAVPMSSAQFQGLTNYLALMNNGDDTSSVEAAITALL